MTRPNWRYKGVTVSPDPFPKEWAPLGHDGMGQRWHALSFGIGLHANTKQEMRDLITYHDPFMVSR